MLFTQILKDPAVFSRLYKKGAKVSGSGVVICFMPNRLCYTRFGITAGKKVGGAVERNRAKRILRAAYRKNELILPIGYDIVAIARPDIVGKKSDSFDFVFKKLAESARREKK